jgi:hypothetical protein
VVGAVTTDKPTPDFKEEIFRVHRLVWPRSLLPGPRGIRLLFGPRFAPKCNGPRARPRHHILHHGDGAAPTARLARCQAAARNAPFASIAAYPSRCPHGVAQAL